LDALLKIPTLTGIQWVPGAGEEHAGSEKWMPVYKKIQSAKKNIIVDNPIMERAGLVTPLYNKLDPKGLIMIVVFMDIFNAKFHLPEFIGGQGGLGDFNTFKKEYRKKNKRKK
jgi:hypothetical protein